ncbi:MAG: hypothetical protein F4Y51_02645 [Cenarchaeum sp. SB0664_bin_35]|nr:hypothetical protein [Cenarchaeum sp. SB0664_bin_35]
MLLLVAYDQDPAGRNMVDYLIQKMTKSGPIYRGESFDLVVLDKTNKKAEWLVSKFYYDGFLIF